MDKRYIIIALIAIIAVIAVAIGYGLMNQNSDVEYERIDLSKTASMEVPKAADSDFKKAANGIVTYVCPSKQTTVTALKTANKTSSRNAEFAAARDSLLKDSRDCEQYNGYEIRQNTVNGTDCYVAVADNQTTNDTILMSCSDLNILKHMLDSLSFKSEPKSADDVTAPENSTAVDSSTQEDGAQSSSDQDDYQTEQDESQEPEEPENVDEFTPEDWDYINDPTTDSNYEPSSEGESDSE